MGSPSTKARQDAAPPEVAQHLLNKRCGASGGAASSRAASARGDLARLIAEREPNICQVCVRRGGREVWAREWNGYRRADCVHVMSATKSVVALLVGIAVDRGMIGGVDEKVVSFGGGGGGVNLETKKTNGMDKEAEQKETFGLSGRFSPLSFLEGRMGDGGGKWETGGKKRETKKTNGMDKEAEQKETFGLSGRFAPLSFLGGRKGDGGGKWEAGGGMEQFICSPDLFDFQNFVSFVSIFSSGRVRA